MEAAYCMCHEGPHPLLPSGRPTKVSLRGRTAAAVRHKSHFGLVVRPPNSVIDVHVLDLKDDVLAP